MKLMLVMHICSALYNTCITAGYQSALDKTKEVGEEDVNKYMIFIKFVCQQDTRIDT